MSADVNDDQAVRLKPRARRLWVVRWIEAGGRNVKHRYYAREHDADRFLASLHAGGWTADIYLTRCEWTAYR